VKEDLGILVFGYSRPLHLADTLESLRRQGAIGLVDLWVDGDQGVESQRRRISVTKRVGDGFDVNNRMYHRGQLGFRKLIMMAMRDAISKYRNVVFLEDDCFPTRHAISSFMEMLDEVRDQEDVFSVYGHHFLVGEENGFSTRFQGWGWATTDEKLKPYLDRLIECYSMNEWDYLAWADAMMTPEVLARIDTTPPREASVTLRNFFAWDETLCLLTALDGMRHRRTTERVIYNAGFGDGSSRFNEQERFALPPFNMVSPNRVWDHF